MDIQLSQLGNIAEDHLNETQDGASVKVEDLFKSGEMGVVGGVIKKGMITRSYFVLQISLDDGSIVSENVQNSSERYRNRIKKLKNQGGLLRGSNHPIGFRLQSAVTQLGMGFAIVIGFALIAGVYDPRTSPVLLGTYYLGIVLFGYYDLKLVQGYGIWNPFGPFWLIVLLFPAFNIFGALGYMGRRWMMISDEN